MPSPTFAARTTVARRDSAAGKRRGLGDAARDVVPRAPGRRASETRHATRWTIALAGSALGALAFAAALWQPGGSNLSFFGLSTSSLMSLGWVIRDLGLDKVRPATRAGPPSRAGATDGATGLAAHQDSPAFADTQPECRLV